MELDPQFLVGGFVVSLFARLAPAEAQKLAHVWRDTGRRDRLSLKPDGYVHAVTSPLDRMAGYGHDDVG